ncbi:response regulator transcription factor [Dongshaea marina]|uniref:response regulator transcription factor n=1 Tax=Dongshaea marina TaxID=2047966 RepID=UPI000D3E065F|nr:response regulator transcription factor [Dongshaea marina]
MSQLLLIEDDPLLGEGLSQFLQRHGYEVDWLQLAQDVESHWLRADLVILDRQLADGDSLQYLASWLSLKALPVIILTARGELEERIDGLAAGARDYVTKPFAEEELLARIHAQLRPLGCAPLNYGPLTLDLSCQQASIEGKEIELTPKEFKLLWMLVQNPRRIYSRDELLNKVWGYQSFPSTRTIDNHILQLRQKFPGLTIETVRGIGYRLK